MPRALRAGLASITATSPRRSGAIRTWWSTASSRRCSTAGREWESARTRMPERLPAMAEHTSSTERRARAVRARPAAMEEGALPGRARRRDLQGADHRRPAVRPLRAARRLLRGRPGADPHHGGRLLPLRARGAPAGGGAATAGSSGWPTPSRWCWSAPRRRSRGLDFTLAGMPEPDGAAGGTVAGRRGSGRPRERGGPREKRERELRAASAAGGGG